MVTLKEIKKRFKLTDDVTIRYSGYGDSGCIDEVEGIDEGEARDALEEWTYAELESRYGGWEINDGSEGTIEIDFDKGTVNWSHGEKVVSYNETEESFG